MWEVTGFCQAAQFFFLPEVHGALFITCNFTLIDSRCFTVLLLVLHQKFIVSIGSSGTIARVFTEWNRNLGVYKNS